MSSQPERKEWIANEVKIRILPPDEYYRLAFLFVANGGQLPAPPMSQIAVAEDSNGDIIGCGVLQLVAHFEPIWVSEDYRNRGVALLLIEKINEIADNVPCAYYSFAENERIAHICVENGMKLLPYTVYLRKPETGED
jgi:GNAT superfamily N-acetyltransferase